MSTTSSSQRAGYALFTIGVLFFIFGFVTWLNGTLIQYLKLVCQLKTDVQAFLVTSAFYMAYFFLALPSAFILQKTGYKNGMALGLLVMALGALLFIPAANARSFPLFLVGLFIQASGLSLLQTASNPYVSVLGPIDSAAQRMSIMGICNKMAGGVAPLILSALVLGNAAIIDKQLQTTTDPHLRETLLTELAGRIQPMYIVMTVVLALLALMIRLSKLPEIQSTEDATGDAGDRSSVLQYPYLLLGVVCILVYVGAEVLVGDYIGPFGRAEGMSLGETGHFTTYPMIAMLVGYITGIITIPKYLSQQAALKICAISGLVFTIGVLTTHGYIAIGFITLLGLSNSLMWPAIWPLALNGLGRFTKIGSALLIMGIVGGALLPQCYAWLKDVQHVRNGLAYCGCLFPCYAYILYYALAGHKAGRRKAKVVPLASRA